MALTIRTEEDRIRIGDRFSVGFHRTLRVPGDRQEFPLPAGLGLFPVRAVSDYPECPRHWKRDCAFFIPMYAQEALWIGFDGAYWKPNAVQIGAGSVNALTGEVWYETLRQSPQNYIVCPEQPWLDGFHAEPGHVRQFVAAVLGRGSTVEEQLSSADPSGGLRIAVWEPKPGHFPDARPTRQLDSAVLMQNAVLEMGMAAGGRIRQKIYPDPHGLAVWDQDSLTAVRVYVLDSLAYSRVTSEPAPPSPITAELYREYALPWFELWDEDRDDSPAGKRLSGIRTLR